ncbi:MAG: ankyrin repeat domain-containing protein [Nitrosomonadales bacterium]|nr:ankyrin repeat domain-containing protein [Nitrosomonadales bacterium]
MASDLMYLSMVHARQSGRKETDVWVTVPEPVRQEIERQGFHFSPQGFIKFNGYAKVVKLLLDKKVDVNARSQHGWTPLLQAATRGHLTVSAMLIEHGANVNAASNDGWTPLHKASANGHFAEVMLLLSKGADAQAQYADGMTPLDIAIKNKQDKIVAALSAKR